MGGRGFKSRSGQTFFQKHLLLKYDYLGCALSGFVSYTLSLSLYIYMYILLTKRKVKMAGYWPSSLFAFLWTETKTELAWSIKDLLYGIKSTEKNDLRTCLFSSTEKEPI